METAPPRPQFSTAVHIYLWLFFGLLGFVPIFVTIAVSGRIPLRQLYWFTAELWPPLIASLLLYARSRCSNERMTFRDGLLWVTSSMMTGWMYQSFFTVFAGLAGAYCAAIFIAFAGDLRRDSGYAPAKWRLIVKFFYSHRMRQ